MEKFKITAAQRYLSSERICILLTIKMNFIPLKSLDNSNIEALISEVDRDKLIYVLQSVREPLVVDFFIPLLRNLH